MEHAFLKEVNLKGKTLSEGLLILLEATWMYFNFRYLQKRMRSVGKKTLFSRMKIV